MSRPAPCHCGHTRRSVRESFIRGSSVIRPPSLVSPRPRLERMSETRITSKSIVLRWMTYNQRRHEADDGGCRMRTLDHPQRDEMRLDAVLSALADPVRRHIVCRLNDCADDSACVAFDLPVSKSTATHHFRVLRSEEHTSELQSRGHLVCRLLLEKKT